MAELVSRFSPEELIATIAIVGGILFLTFAVAGDIWLKARKAGIAAKLKTDMLDRGMSAEEIRIVLDAGTPPSRSRCGA